MKNNFPLVLCILVLFLFGCKKLPTEDLSISSVPPNSQSEKVAVAVGRGDIDPDMLAKMMVDTNFLHLMQVVESITLINDTLSSGLDESTLPAFIDSLNVLETDYEAQQLFEEYGVPNSAALFALAAQIHPLVFKIFSEEEAFQSFLDEEAVPLLAAAIHDYFESTPIIHMEERTTDECSDNYGAGMSNCDDNFAIGVGGTFLTTVLITVGSGGIGIFGAGMTISSGIGISLASLGVCQNGVFNAWKICRQYHPLPA